MKRRSNTDTAEIKEVREKYKQLHANKLKNKVDEFLEKCLP